MKNFIKTRQCLKPFRQVILLVSILAFYFPTWAAAGVFVDNLTTPTGLAIHPTQRYLYIKSGNSGTIWKAEIMNNGEAGNVSVVTNNFPPLTDIDFDFQGNLYGITSDKLYRLAPDGIICWVNGYITSFCLGVAIESPGFSSNRLFAINYYMGGYDLSQRIIANIPCNTFTDSVRIGATCGPIRYLIYSARRGKLIASLNNVVNSIDIGSGQCQTLISNLIQPNGLAEDQQGNIYVADTGDGSITQLSLQGGTKQVAQGFYLPTGLAYDTQTGLLFVSETGLNRVSVFSLIDPAISLNTMSLTPSCQRGQKALSQKFEIWDSGGGTLNYNISWNDPWLNVSPSSGSSTGEHDSITVSYSTANLPLGTYTDFVTINAPGATNSPQQIRVDLKVVGASSASSLLLLLD